MKALACNRLYQISRKNDKQVKKRAVDIWKQGLQSIDHRMFRFRSTLRKIHNTSMKKAWSKWIGYNENVETAVRLRLLHINSSERLMLSQTFNNLKIAARSSKFSRLRKLKLCFHEWRNFNRYNRHLMLSNLAAI